MWRRSGAHRIRVEDGVRGRREAGDRYRRPAVLRLRQQGIAYFDGQLFVTADDGDAGEDEVDNLWRVSAEADGTASFIVHENSFDEFRRAGEIEGLDFDVDARELVVLSNRGKQIVLGIPTGLYPGYDREVHEVYVFSLPGS